MKLKVIASLLILILALLLVFTPMLGITPVAASPTEFYISPTQLYSYDGGTFSYTVRVDAVSNMWGYNVTLAYDPYYLDFSSAVASDLIPAWSMQWFNVTPGVGEVNIVGFAYSWGASGSVPPGTPILFAVTMETLNTPPTAGTPVNITQALYYNGTAWPGTERVADLPPEPHLLVRYPPPPTVIEWLTHWTDLAELEYWDHCIAEFEAEYPDIRVVMISVSIDVLYNILMGPVRPAMYPELEPDLIHIPAMLIPGLVDYDILSMPPADVQADVYANWTQASIDQVKHICTPWGYPTEYNSWALYYSKTVLGEVALTNATVAAALATLNAGGTLTWGSPSIGSGELEKVAEACTQYDGTGTMNRSGFYPIWVNYTEGEKKQFLSMLWSNGGTDYDFDKTWNKQAVFNSPEGVEVLELYKWCNGKTFDGTVFPGGDIWWGSWEPPVEIAMMILPTWMGYIRYAMGVDFNNDTIGVAPSPVGPSGTAPVSVVDGWVNVVTKAAETRNETGITHAEAAWTFLKWLNSPKAAEASYAPDLGGETDISRMAEFLVMDSIIPSRASDQASLKTGPGCNMLETDFWFKAFVEIGEADGRAETYFRTFQQIQDRIGLMCESVALCVEAAQAGADDAAADVSYLLPIPGDIVPDDRVDIRDLRILAKAYGTKGPNYYYPGSPASPRWNPRCDLKKDGRIAIFDLVVIARNYGKKK